MGNNSDPIRILMIVPNLRVSNGVASFAMNYFRQFDTTRFQVDFVTYKSIESPYIDELKSKGCKIFVLPSVKRNPFKHVKMCMRIVKEGRYDVVHDNSLMITYPLMFFAKRRIPIRILHSHSVRLGETEKTERRNRRFMPLLLKTVNVHFACSSNAAKSMFGSESYTLIPNAINPDKYKYNSIVRDEMRKNECASDKTIIGTVGRLTDAKNPFFAFDVLNSILKKRSDAEYWWVGSGILDEEAYAYVDKLPTKKQIKLLGTREDVERLYQAMDLFFLPSKCEGFGLSCLEAQCVGLPCVVSTEFPQEVDITGNVEFVSLDKGVDYWAETILSHLRNTVDRDLAYEKVYNSKYSTTSSSDILFDEYANLVNELKKR